MGNFPSNDAGVADTPGTATAASQEDAHVEIMATPGREQIVTGENAISGAQLRGTNVETVQPAGLNPSVYTGDSGLETELGTQSPIASSHSQYYPHDFYFEEDEMGVRRSTPFTRGRRYIQERRQIWTPSETPYRTPMVSLVDMDQETAAYFEHMRRRVPLSPPLSDRVEFATNTRQAEFDDRSSVRREINSSQFVSPDRSGDYRTADSRLDTSAFGPLGQMDLNTDTTLQQRSVSTEREDDSAEETETTVKRRLNEGGQNRMSTLDSDNELEQERRKQRDLSTSTCRPNQTRTSSQNKKSSLDTANQCKSRPTRSSSSETSSKSHSSENMTASSSAKSSRNSQSSSSSSRSSPVQAGETKEKSTHLNSD
jgi:hypothetical protein